MSISTIRDGLATNLATISGLRTKADIPDNPSPPVAVVSLNSVSYDQAFKQGLALYNFTITVIVGRVSERTAQARLNAYASTGAGGVKNAIQSDKTLGGAAFDVRMQVSKVIWQLSFQLLFTQNKEIPWQFSQLQI